MPESTIQEIVKVLEDVVARLDALTQIPPNHIQTTALDRISRNLGLVSSGEFRSGNNKEPGRGFTGVRMGFPGFSYLGKIWNMVGVDSDSLKFGLRADDGSAYFLGGDAVIGENGIIVTSMADAVIQHMIVGSSERYGYLGALFLAGETIPGWGIRFQSPSVSSELLTNPLFTSNLSSWTALGAYWSSDFFGHTGIAVLGGGNSLSQSISVSASVDYVFEATFNRQVPSTAKVEWYDGSSVLLRTDYLFNLASGGSWQTKSVILTSPVSSATVKIIFDVGSAYGSPVFWIDSASFKVAAIYNHLVFHPESAQLISLSEAKQIASPLIGKTYLRVPTYRPGGNTLAGGTLPAGNYYYKLAYYDGYGETTPTPASLLVNVANPNNKVNITWSNAGVLDSIPKIPQDAAGIRIYRSTDNVNFYFAFDYNDNAVSFLTDNGYTVDTSRTPSTSNTTISRSVYPQRWHMFADELETGALVWSPVNNSSQRYGFYYETTTANCQNGNERSAGFFLGAGSYTLYTLGTTNTSHGLVDYLMDEVVVKSGQDWYSGSSTLNVEQEFNFTIAESGYHHLLLRINGKNASSSNYTVRLTKMWIKPNNLSRVQE